MATYIMWW